ncbi:carbonic anhydrase [Domibacillus antri]|uniref:carbonic anhydrase n=1 Tax=Domibacillus antri TaxID=1714264 RepID=A0A1Q8Q8Y5_9BACI|nr:carbonic anhydrase family protein [Domibacillus antri]OLN23761.1 carbonic anhydrase [Domibacillus antri]
MRSKYAYLIAALSVSFLLGACSDQTKETQTEEDQPAQTQGNQAEKASDVHWSYKEGETGPDQWGKLDASYAACMNGSEQSPVNIEFSQVKTSERSGNIETHYAPGSFSVVHNGHTIQVNAEGTDNRMTVEESEYNLVQLHFHTPSEHQFNGRHLDMELHLVHQNANGELAVLGVMIREGKENENLASVWEKLPKEETENGISVKELDLHTLLPENQASFYYNGSLTTPPCTEEVKWIVLEQPIEMSKEQIQAFQQIFPDNHRPVQSLNEREIMKN